MGKVSLMGPDGHVLTSTETYFGIDTPDVPRDCPEYANNGEITDLEISDARQKLEHKINQQICGYGGPVGLGGWGGINEVCVQPWNLTPRPDGAEPRDNAKDFDKYYKPTPDGSTMQVTLHLEETYSVPTGTLFFTERRTKVLDIPMNMRWENGSVRLYQCTPPLYSPPPPPPPAPDIVGGIKEAGVAIATGVSNFFSGAKTYANSAIDSITRYFS